MTIQAGKVVFRNSVVIWDDDKMAGEVFIYDYDTDAAEARARMFAAADDMMVALNTLIEEARKRGGAVSNGERLGCIAIAKASA